MRFNNRMPVFSPPSILEKKSKYRTVKNGKSVWVEGERLDPYKGISVDSLALRSRIDSGTFEFHEGKPIQLEKANGVDKLSQMVEDSINELELKNSTTRKMNSIKKHIDDARHRMNDTKSE